MNLLFDFLTVYIKTGVGEYQRRVFFETMRQIQAKNRHMNVFALYDSSMGIAYDDLKEEAIGSKFDVHFLDCKDVCIVDLVNKYQIDRFFIACAQHFRNKPEIAKLKCDVVCVSHDLCFEENYKDKIYLYWDLIEPESDKPAKFSKLGCLRNVVPINKILNRFDEFSWKYVRGNGNERYKSSLDIIKPVMNMYHNNPNVKMVVVSEYSKCSLMYYYDIKESDISVLYSPERVEVQLEEYDNEMLKELIGSRKKYYLMVSANRIAKNPHKVINAFEKFARKHPDSYLVTLGYKEKAFVNHISLPFLNDSDLAYAFSNCYALIYPSFFEGFGYPPIEAMHYGKPVLCSNTTSMPEILDDAPIFFSPFYESAIFGALCKLNDDNYSFYEDKSSLQYTKLRERQENDLRILVDMLLKES